MAQGGTTTSYEYDAQQQRLKQTTGGSTIVYLNDPVTGIGAELHPGSSNWQVYIQDHQGSVAVVTDITGAVIQRLGYDAWGRRRQPNGTDDPAGSITAPTSRGYTDHEHVPGSLINMNGRMFDPEVGRFLSADPVIPNLYRTQAQNRYSYVYNNPGRYTDPNGYQPASDIPVITVTGSRYDSSTYGPPHNSWFGSYYFVGFDSDFWPGYVSWGGGSLASPGRHMPPGLASTIQSLRQTKPLGEVPQKALTLSSAEKIDGVVQIIGRRAGGMYGDVGGTGVFRYAQEGGFFGGIGNIYNRARSATADFYGDVAFGVNAVIDGVSQDLDQGGISEVLIRATGGRSNQGFFEQVHGNYRDTSIVLGPITNLDKKAVGVGFGAAITRRYGGYSFGQLIRNGPAPHLGTYGASARLATATTVVNSAAITVSYEGGNYVGSLLRTTINRTARAYQERFGD